MAYQKNTGSPAALGFALIAFAAFGCDTKGGEQISSTSHWLVCSVKSDCADLPSAVACTGGYCVDAAGERVLVTSSAEANGSGGDNSATNGTGTADTSAGSGDGGTVANAGTAGQTSSTGGTESGAAGAESSTGGAESSTAGGDNAGGANTTTGGTGGSQAGGSGGEGGSGTAGSTSISAEGCDMPVPWPFACVDDTPWLVDGQDTGYANCASDATHRVAQKECPLLLAEAPAGSCSADSACQSNADCGDHRICYEGSSAGTCSCSSSDYCQTDADCDAGKICQCGTVVGVCVGAECADDSECADGELCLLAGGGSFSCRSLGTVETSNCPSTCDGVCGCDGQSYCNTCQANSAGINTTPTADCVPGDGIAGDPCFTEQDCGTGFICCSSGIFQTHSCVEGTACPQTP